MFTRKSGKFMKKKTNIMRVFTDTVSSLNLLQKKTKTEIEAQEKKIEEELKEKNALELEEKDTSRMIKRMNNILGVKEEAPETVTETATVESMTETNTDAK